MAVADALRDGSDAPTCVGFSGGLDSTVLLHALASDPAVRESGLRALHVHHGLHPDADAWAAHCSAFCDALDVALTVARVAVVADGRGPEAAARGARHAAFADALDDGEVLALAHHRDDQAETFLLRALRGSGPDGLAAMQPTRRCGRGVLWRPLLDVPRTALLDYARLHGLRWIEDPSNTDTALDRNFLRNRVMPLLRERWPEADAALARSAALSAEATRLLAADDAAALSRAATADPAVLSRAGLAQLPRERRARVLRHWVASLGLPPLPAGGVAAIESDLLGARADSDACFAWSGAVVRAWRDGLHAGMPVTALPGDWSVQWDGRTALALPGGGSLRLEGTTALDDAVTVRARTGGERIVLPGRGHSHALKHVLQDLGIPPWQRMAMPVLVDAAGALLAAGDRVASADFDAWLRARGAQLAWSP